MAYMRGDYYLWTDGSGLHLWAADGYDGWDNAGWHCPDVDDDDNPVITPRHLQDGENTASGVSIHQKIMDEYVMMRLAEMIHEGSVPQAIERAIDSNLRGGNFGGRMLEKNAETLKAALAGLAMEKPEPIW